MVPRINPSHTRAYAARALAAILILVAGLAASSCSRRIGWGVVLWPPEGSALEPGALVPVRFMSNISRTYAVDVPDAKAVEELELWRLSFFPKRSAAKAWAAEFAEFAPLFGIATRDGLLLRAKPDNKADQVYRLRLDQAVKLIAKVQGETVMTGDEALAGDWYEALSDDGTPGYVFSNQLALWDSKSEPRPDHAALAPSSDASLSLLFETVWRPDYYDAMVDSGRLDLGAYSPRFGLFVDPVQRQMRVERVNFSKVYRYDSIVKRDDGSYELVPTGATFAFRKTGALVFTPPAADAPSAPAGTAAAAGVASPATASAEPFTLAFQRQRDDPKDVVAAEERRRLSLLSDFVARGERYESERSGVLIVTRSARVTWAAYGALSPEPIPEGSGETGSIAMDLYLSPELAERWKGAFTIRFDGGQKPAVSFAYRFTNDGLELAWIRPENVAGAVASALAPLPDAISFSRYR